MTLPPLTAASGGVRYQWRHWQPAPRLGKRGRMGKWRDCTREEYERTDNNACTEKRIVADTAISTAQRAQGGE